MLYDTFLIYGTAYVILGLCFAIFGILTISSLKQSFRNFYDDNFWYCVIATVGLSIPLIFRGMLDILKGSHKRFFDFTENRESFSLHIVSFVFGDIVPLAFQLFSLIFGYIRRQRYYKNKKQLLAETQVSDGDHTNSLSQDFSRNNNSMAQGEDDSHSYFDPPLMT